MVLYCSHFLQNEIDALVKMFETKKNPIIKKIIINHHRFTILDFYSITHYEFTPFSFGFVSPQKDKSEEIQEKSSMMEVEKLYH